MTGRRTRRACTMAAPLLLVAALAGCEPDLDPVRLAEDLREPASPVLLESLREGSSAERVRAAVAMGRIQSASYARPLAEASRTSHRDVRLAALFALGQLGLARGAEPAPAAVEACREATADPDVEIARRAVEALGKLAPPDAAGTIVPLLGHTAPDVRAEAALALFRLRFVPLWRGEADEAPPLAPDAVEALVAAIDDSDSGVRYAATYACSRYGQPEAVEALLGRLDEADAWTRLFAVRAIGNSGDPAVAGRLVAVQHDAVSQVRTAAVEALRSLEATALLAPELVDDPTFHVRAALATALADDGAAGSLEVLRRLAGDDSPTVRGAAITSLAARLGARYREQLESHLKDEAWTIRVAAARAGGRLDPAIALPLLRAAAGDPDVRVRCAALGALPEQGGDDLIETALAANDLAERGTAVSLVARRERPDRIALLERAYDGSAGTEWIEVRESIVDALEGLQVATPLLRRIAAGDPAPSVRDRARLTLRDAGLEAPEPEPPPATPSPLLDEILERDVTVVLQTSRGDLRIRVLASEAPLHATNFVNKVRAGFYDGLPWHRVVSNFVIQGGDPRGDGWGGAEPTLRDEINTWRYARGTVGMPKAGKDTGSCQIFITHIPTPHLDGNYTVFGAVTEGDEVLDRIEVGDSIERARVE